MEATNPLPSSIATALVKAQKESQGVEKGKEMKGQKFSYKFAGAEAVIEEARRALATAELGVFVADWQSLGSNGHTRIAARFCLVHTDGASWMSDPVSFPAIANAGRPPDKAEASALTYVTNYFLTRLLNLPRTDSEDVSARDDSDYTPPQKAAQDSRSSNGSSNGNGDDEPLVLFGKDRHGNSRKGMMFRYLYRQNPKAAKWYVEAIQKSCDDPEKERWRDTNLRHLAALHAVIAEEQGQPPLPDEQPPLPDEPPPFGDDFQDEGLPF